MSVLHLFCNYACVFLLTNIKTCHYWNPKFPWYQISVIDVIDVAAATGPKASEYYERFIGLMGRDEGLRDADPWEQKKD